MPEDGPIFDNNQDLLTYRGQVQNIQIAHMEILLNVQKYFTTLISALLSINITLVVTILGNFTEATTFFEKKNELYLLFTVIPFIIIIISHLAIKNNYREYRNFMEQLAVKMKIDTLLKVYDKDVYKKYKEKLTLSGEKILFPDDESFANQRWRKDLTEEDPKLGKDEKVFTDGDSGEFPLKLATNKKIDRANVYRCYAFVFEVYMFIGFFSIANIISFVFFTLSLEVAIVCAIISLVATYLVYKLMIERYIKKDMERQRNIKTT